MSKLLHIKGSRTQVLKTLPTNDTGNDGDIVISVIQGRGIYLCIKANNRWYVSTKLEELRKIGKTTTKDLKANRVKIGNTTITKDEYDVGEGDFTLDVGGDIELNADGGQVIIKDASAYHFQFDCDSTTLYIIDDTNALDRFAIAVTGNGATTLSTTDNDGALGHLTLEPNGDLLFKGCDVKMNAAKNLYLDGGVDTFIREHSDDYVRYTVGGDVMVTMGENGADGNQVIFADASVGFTQLEPSYDAVSTTVDFRLSNKQFLTFGSGNIGHMLLYFPPMSGNFVLLIKQDGTGSRTVTGQWKVYEFDESVADGEAAVKWAGGSAPTLTTDANHVDILSFYWDADNEIAYGVATLDFQF